MNGMQFSPRQEGEEQLKALKRSRRLRNIQIPTRDNSQVDGHDEGLAAGGEVFQGLAQKMYIRRKISIFFIFPCSASLRRSQIASLT